MSAPAIAIFGPTASGKSALALALARRLDAVVINADALQVYRDLRLLTARPDARAEAEAPHRLYGVLDAAERCSVARWRDLAVAELARARAEGRRAILVGGTGLYLKALSEGLSPIPPVPEEMRAAVQRRLAEEGPQALYAALAARDPEAAQRIRPGDPQRIARAVEVLEATGRSLIAWQRAVPEGEGVPLRLVALAPPRAALAETIAARLEAMLAAGVLDEIAALVARRLDPRLPAMKAVGLRELAGYLSGTASRAAALAAAAAATRRYAKRQETWLRTQIKDRQSSFIAPTFINAQYSSSILPELLSKVT